MQTIILIVHVLASLSLIGLILIQQGKGADMGAAFGSGASSTVFGSQGAGSFITRSTAILAAVFFITSLSLAYFSGQGTERRSVTDIVAPSAQPVAPDLPMAPGSGSSAPAIDSTPEVEDLPAAPAPVVESPSAVEKAPALTPAAE